MVYPFDDCYIRGEAVEISGAYCVSAFYRRNLMIIFISPIMIVQKSTKQTK